MDPLKVAADTGATLDTTSTFTVADVDHLTAFTKVGPLYLCLAVLLIAS
jgi:hypothetical protein